jgi:hypothetical protein
LSVETLLSILGPTLALTLAGSVAAILRTYTNSVRIGIIEKTMATQRSENAQEHEQIKSLVIESEKRILQAIRNTKGMNGRPGHVQESG